MPDTAQKQTKKDKWIPWYFVIFFVVLAILDGIFVTIALSTHTGVVTENAYQKGLEYNQTLAASKQQEKLGWHGTATFAQPSLSFSLKDANGRAIQGAIVTAYISRATQGGHDFQAVLADGGDGTYSRNITFPLKGQWDITIAVIWKQQQHQQSQRVLVK